MKTIWKHTKSLETMENKYISRDLVFFHIFPYFPVIVIWFSTGKLDIWNTYWRKSGKTVNNANDCGGRVSKALQKLVGGLSSPVTALHVAAIRGLIILSEPLPLDPNTLQRVVRGLRVRLKALELAANTYQMAGNNAP